MDLFDDHFQKLIDIMDRVLRTRGLHELARLVVAQGKRMRQATQDAERRTPQPADDTIGPAFGERFQTAIKNIEESPLGKMILATPSMTEMFISPVRRLGAAAADATMPVKVTDFFALCVLTALMQYVNNSTAPRLGFVHLIECVSGFLARLSSNGEGFAASFDDAAADLVRRCHHAGRLKRLWWKTYFLVQVGWMVATCYGLGVRAVIGYAVRLFMSRT